MNKERDDSLRSWVLLLAGLTGMAYQQWTGNINELLLLIFTSMTGMPGLAHLISLVRSSITALQSPYVPQESRDTESDNSSQSMSEDRP